jgi:SsrA-binding protein
MQAEDGIAKVAPIRQYTPMSRIDNKRGVHDYSIIETMEAGLELFGYEVKSLRAGHGSLKGARVVARGGEAYLVGATIPPFQIANAPKSYDPERTRRLLLNKKQIADVLGAESERGLTVIPISVYNKGRVLKIEIAIAKGKKNADKRASIKERDTKRDIARTLKSK